MLYPLKVAVGLGTVSSIFFLKTPHKTLKEEAGNSGEKQTLLLNYIVWLFLFVVGAW